MGKKYYLVEVDETPDLEGYYWIILGPLLLFVPPILWIYAMVVGESLLVRVLSIIQIVICFIITTVLFFVGTFGSSFSAIYAAIPFLLLVWSALVLTYNVIETKASGKVFDFVDDGFAVIAFLCSLCIIPLSIAEVAVVAANSYSGCNIVHFLWIVAAVIILHILVIYFGPMLNDSLKEKKFTGSKLFHSVLMCLYFSPFVCYLIIALLYVVDPLVIWRFWGANPFLLNIIGLVVLVCLTFLLRIGEAVLLFQLRNGPLTRYGIVQGVLSLVLAAATVASTFVVWAKAPPAEWHLRSVSDLNAMFEYQQCETYDGGNFYLECDIDLNGGVIRLHPSTSRKFRGVFDGQGHAISNAKIEGALFGHNYGGEIKNLTLEHCFVYGQNDRYSISHFGAITTYNDESYHDRGKIFNCHVLETYVYLEDNSYYSSSNLSYKSVVCGIVGYNRGTIEHCSFVNSNADPSYPFSIMCSQKVNFYEIACNDNDRYYPGTTEDCIFQGTYGMGRPSVA